MHPSNPSGNEHPAVAEPRRLPSLFWPVVALAGVLLPLSLSRQFVIDEFDYANMAWLFAQGQLPYVDFFDHHFPLLYQLLSVPFLFGDEPTTIRWLRLAPWVGMVCLALGLATLNRPYGRVAMLGSWSVFLLVDFTAFALEIRPDSVALALMVGSLALVADRQQVTWRRALTAGILLGCAVWIAQRVVIYGLPLAIPASIGLFHRLRGRSTRDALGHTPWYLAGIAVVGGGALLYLFTTGSWAAFWRWCFEWSIAHESLGRRFDWQPAVLPLIGPHLALVVLGLLGWLTTLLQPRESLAWRLLMAALPISALLSFTFQSAPYPYSRLPLLAFVCLFSGRGLGLVVARVRREARTPLRTLLIVALGAIALFWVATGGLQLLNHARLHNRQQLETLRAIGRLTDPTDHVYANSGSFVSRPPTGFYPFTNAYVRQTEREAFTSDIPNEILRRRTKAFLIDTRFGGLSPDLQRHLLSHFAPYNSDLWLWGRRMTHRGEGITDQFVAIEEGRYFVHPETALEVGQLQIDREPITSPVFELTAGPHEVRFDGPPGAIAILWLPRDGERWSPGTEGPPTFSVLFAR